MLPALSSVVRRVQGRGQPRPPTRTRPARPPRTNTSNPSADTSTGADTSTDIPRWLEEAQRRVREAQQSEADQRDRRGQARTSTPKPQAARPLVQPRPSVTRPNPVRQAPVRQAPVRQAPTGLEDYRPEAVSLERTASPTSRSLSTPAPPLRVQRVGTQRSATLGSYKMRFDEPTLMTGFVWHQILSPPLSKRRTHPSRRQP